MNEKNFLLCTNEREINEDIRKVLNTPDDRQLEVQLLEFKKNTENKLLAVKSYEEIEDQLLSLNEVCEIEKSLNGIRKDLKAKKKKINDVIADIIGDNEIKPIEMREKIGLSIDD